MSPIAPIDDPNLALFIYRATDCLEDMSQSAIAHDGILSFGDEKQNIQVERAFEEGPPKVSAPCACVPLHFSPTRIPTKPGEQATYDAILRSDRQGDEQHQPERHFPL